jgi:hypothetical protein
MGKGSGGGSTNTVVQNSQPPQQFLNAYQNAVTQAQGVASTPYQPYGGQIVAPLTGSQQAAIANAPSSSGDWSPYAGQAQSYLGQATGTDFGGTFAPYASNAMDSVSAAATPFYDTVNNYLSPYVGDVVNSTEQQFNNQNAIQQSQVQGNAVSQGAWGGDRSAVAQGIVAGQQQANEAPVIAGLYNSGYGQAMSADEAQGQLNLGAAQTTGQIGSQMTNAQEANAWLASNAASQEGQLGLENFNVDQGTLNQEMQFGSLAQAQNQAELNVPYEQYQASQAYPFQTAGWLANIEEGIGSGAGGTSQTTSPGASPVSQALGLGVGGLGILGATGAFGSSGYLTGAGGLLSSLGSGADIAGLGADSAIDATGVSSAADIASGLPLLFRRGGVVPRRDNGGSIADSGTAALLNAISATGKADVDALLRGGIVRRQGGGDVPTQIGAMPYQQMPQSSDVPNVGISIVPQLPQMRGGTGPPRPPQAAPNTSNLTPQGIMGMLQQSGGFGQNGWLGQLSSGIQGSRRGGGVAPPRYQDGGDLVSGLPPPDQPTYLGISPDMRSGSGPPALAAAPAPSVPASGQSGAAPSIPAAAPLADVISGGGLGPLVNQVIRNEGGSPKGVANNPGNIKFAGLPGQVDSGVRATDGGTFASYASPEDGRNAVAQLAVNAARGASPSYGKSPTVASFMDTYEGHQEGARASQTGHSVGERPSNGPLGTAPPGAPPLEAPVTSEPGAGVVPSSMPSGGISGQPAGMYSPGVNPWLALAAAGFATAAGRSPQALQNIGAGMLTGVQTLESERAALPDQQLKLAQGQMANLQVQNAQAMRAYFNGQHADPSPVADQLDRNIDAARTGIAKSGETQAVSTPTGAMAPLAGTTQGTPLSTDEQAMSGQVQSQIANIDRIIAQQSDLARFASTPEQMSSMQANLANLAIRRSELLKEDPAYLRAASQAEGEGKVGPAIQQAAGEAAAKLPYTVTTARPGSYILQGGQPVAATPLQRPAIDPATGNEYPRFVTPPLPGQVAPTATGATGASPPPAGAQGVPPNGSAAAGIAPGEVPSKLGVGPETALRERAEAEQKDRQETIEGGESAQTQQAILSRLKDDAPQFTQGPFAGYTQTANTYLRALFGTQAPQVASYEDFVKNAGSLTRAAVRETSSRAAVQEFRLIDATLPSPEMSPQGLQQVINEYQGLNDFKLAKVQAQQQWEQQHGGIGNVQGFETDWQAKVSPYAFVFNRMDPAEQTGLVSRLSATPDGRAELSHLAQQLQYAKSAGLEPYIQ